MKWDSLPGVNKTKRKKKKDFLLNPSLPHARANQGNQKTHLACSSLPTQEPQKGDAPRSPSPRDERQRKEGRAQPPLPRPSSHFPAPPSSPLLSLYSGRLFSFHGGRYYLDPSKTRFDSVTKLASRNDRRMDSTSGDSLSFTTRHGRPQELQAPHFGSALNQGFRPKRSFSDAISSLSHKRVSKPTRFVSSPTQIRSSSDLNPFDQYHSNPTPLLF